MALTDLIGVDFAFQSDFIAGANGDFSTVDGIPNLTEALLRRLITQPGSLIHRPDYGVGIKDFQNGINSIANQQKLALTIKEQFEKDPRVKSVDGVQVIVDDFSPDRTQFLVRVTAVGYDETVMTFMPFGDG